MGCKSTCCVVDSQNAVKQSAAYCYEHGGVAFLSRSNNGQRDVQDDTETRATREALGDDDDDVASDFGFGFDGV